MKFLIYAIVFIYSNIAISQDPKLSTRLDTHEFSKEMKCTTGVYIKTSKERGIEKESCKVGTGCTYRKYPHSDTVYLMFNGKLLFDGKCTNCSTPFTVDEWIYEKRKISDSDYIIERTKIDPTV